MSFEYCYPGDALPFTSEREGMPGSILARGVDGDGF